VSRDADEIADELRALGPDWLFPANAIGRALSRGTAVVLAYVEELAEALEELADRRTSEGPWLDALAKDRGTERLPWESDEQLADEAQLRPGAATPDRIRQQCRRRLRFEGYDVEVHEPRLVGTPTDTGIAEDPDAAFYVGPSGFLAPDTDNPFVVFVVVPVPEVAVYEVGPHVGDLDAEVYTGFDCYTPAAPFSENRQVFRAVERWLEAHFGHGVDWRMIIRDTPEVAHLSHIQTTGSIL